jgi:hypothetical protein
MTRGADWIEQMVAILLPDGPRAVTLDEVGQAIGEDAVGSAEVEALLDCLESAGATIVESSASGLAPLLKTVIETARELRAEGKRPSPENVAERSGLSARAVRVALLYADVLRG